MANYRLCSVPDCGKPHRAKGLCNAHYERIRLKDTRKSTPSGDVQRFYRDVVLLYEGDDCLIWPYSRGQKGYARMMRNGKAFSVSRLLCTEVNGEPPTPKHHAAHSCGKGMDACVTKSHLVWKTPSENEADKRVHGTFFLPTSVPRLTESQAREILALKGKETQGCTAAKYKISRQSVSLIQRRITWSWL